MYICFVGFMFYLCILVSNAISISEDVPVVLTVTRRVAHVKQKLLTLPEFEQTAGVFS
jgi:hypothetical protein